MLQRDFEADGGLTPLPEIARPGSALPRRRGASRPCYEELGLRRPTQDMKQSVVVASGSDETRSYMPRDVALISEAIKARGISVIDVIKALAKRGFGEEAENLLSRREASCLRRLFANLGHGARGKRSSAPSTIPTNIWARAPATASPKAGGWNSIPSATCWTRRKCCAPKPLHEKDESAAHPLSRESARPSRQNDKQGCRDRHQPRLRPEAVPDHRRPSPVGRPEEP